MNYLEFLKLLPGIEEPEKKLNFKDKLKWTGIILILFLVMGEVVLWGVDPQAIQRFQFLETIMGSTMGTLVTLGIGPIVTSSIILQLLTGSGILPWDTNSRQGKIKFQGTQKLLGIVFTIFESIAFVVSGAIPALNSAFIPILILQLTSGGIMVLFMDEVISKWGFGSGISLFIAAGVSKGIFIGALNFVGNTPGAIPATIISLSAGKTVEALANMIPLIFTVVVFLGVVYAQAMKVEVPLTFGRASGFGRRWPLKFVYASNIPVILASALLANLRLWGRMMANNGLPILGTFNASGQPVSGLLYYLSPPRGHDLSNIVVSYLTGSSVPPVTVTWITYTLYLIAAAVVFSVFWIQTSGKDSKSVAEQISNAGLSVPGFRQDIRVIQRVLGRYITPLTVMGAVTVGLFAAMADFTGALGTGTGILLSVMIVYNLYEEISKQHMEDMHPALRKFME